MGTVTAERVGVVLHPDPRRVVGRPYIPGDDTVVEGKPRLHRLVERVLAIPDDEVKAQLEDIRLRFSHRHRSVDRMLARNHEVVDHLLDGVSEDRCLLVGAYLTQECAFEGAALTNPSMVRAPDQSGLAAGAKRFIMSLRAIGEGHLSSIEFRKGVLDRDHSVQLDPHKVLAETGERRAPVYERKLFSVKLNELGADHYLTAVVLDQLPRLFSAADLQQATAVLDDLPRAVSYETVKLINWLAASNYVVYFDPETTLEERLLWPEGPFESRGMEDARFVHFAETDGTTTYYATYTAYDGTNILPQLIETNDFRTFEITTMNGSSVQNKGMALFPRQVGGRYLALSRPDRENIHLISSGDPRFWSDPSTPLRYPTRPWELIQMGNCGSPLETAEGWLVLTHGVGPMRTYRLGLLLLDLERPERVIAELPDPILEVNDDERDGYVPNVVYSCGGMIDNDRLLIPYGFSDRGAAIARFSVPDLLDALLANREPQDAASTES